MNKPTITLAVDEHRKHELVNLFVEKDYALIGRRRSIPCDAKRFRKKESNNQEFLIYKSYKTNEIYPDGSDYNNHQISVNVLLSRGG